MPITTTTELRSAANVYPSPPCHDPADLLDNLDDLQSVSWTFTSLTLELTFPSAVLYTPLRQVVLLARDLTVTSIIALLTVALIARDLSISSAARDLTVTLPSRDLSVTSVILLSTVAVPARDLSLTSLVPT